MTRQEALAIAKPILFNTLMVQAILDNRKTVSRRVIKPQPNEQHKFKLGFVTSSNHAKDIGKYGWGIDGYGGAISYVKPPYKVGDILYVRETGLIQSMKAFGNKVKMLFKADDSLVEFSVSGKEYKRLSKWAYFQKWLSPYWLTKETARIFLRVTVVKAERLQDITEEQAKAEGVITNNAVKVSSYRYWFEELWDSTIPKADLDEYGWNANSWVWVIEFERVEVV